MADAGTAVIAAGAALGGAILGVIGGALDRRLAWIADREARREMRQAERDALQRSTLIEFQEVLGRYVRAVGKETFHDRRTLKESGKRTQLPEGVSDEEFEEGRRLRQLALRVRDDELRTRWTKFWAIASSYGTTLQPKTLDEIDEYMMRTFVPAHQALEERLGEVLRPLL
jgi:hypothetical protein